MRESEETYQNPLDRNLSCNLSVHKAVVRSTGGLVTAQNRVAAQVGADILKAGGNAVDAAIAVSFALGIVEPWMSGPGGGGAMLVYDADRQDVTAISFGMRSPKKLNPEDFPLTGGWAKDLFGWPAVVDDRNLFGTKAIGVPGQVAGMASAHRRFASLPWDRLLQPAVALAEEGPVIDWLGSLAIAAHAYELAAFPASSAAFLRGGRVPFSAVDPSQQERFDFSAAANSLRLLATEGPQAFYEGPLAKSICDDIRDMGGYLAEEDLADYEASESAPLRFETSRAKFYSSPGLTAGPTLMRCFSLWPEESRRGGNGPGDGRPGEDTPARDFYCSFAEAMGQAYAERLAEMGDRGPPDGCTSHFNVVDAKGNIVAVTQTLLSLFGSKVLLPRSGFLMNNGIMWFDPVPGRPNSIGPGKACLMNICPTLAELPDARLALGASGGRKIVGAVAQLAAFITDCGMDLESAFHQPRIDVSGPQGILADDSLPPDVLAALAEKTSMVPARRSFLTNHFANACGLQIGTGRREGMTEPMALMADSVAVC